MTQGIWITGIGMVTPLGFGLDDNWSAMCAGQSGTRPIRSFDASGMESQIAGEVPPGLTQQFKQHCRLLFPNRFARFTKLALLSSHYAMQDAGISPQDFNPRRTGISVGVGAGSFHYLLPVSEALREQGKPLESVMDHNFIVKYMSNAATAQISMWLNLQGPCANINVACASGAQSIAMAMDWIRHGKADVVLAGGTDSTVSRFAMHAYSQINALSTRNDDAAGASRPFAKDRDGFVMSEGACILVLESEQHARARAVEPYAQLIGQAYNTEAYNVVSPRPGGEGIADSIQRALVDAKTSPKNIDYINAHGTSTPINDVSETAGIKRVFGDRAYQIPVSSQKSMIGHSIGSSSAIQTGITAMSLKQGMLTPTINLDEADPECDLDYVPNQAREKKIDYALSNAFGFGGFNCCLVLSRV